jgi:four helix bundle protein
MGDYKKMEVWRRSRALCIRVDQMIAKLPAEIRANVRDQLGESVGSIRHNIAEGAGLRSDPLLAKHLRTSLGSANEAQDQFDRLDERGVLPPEDRDLTAELTEIRAMLAGFLDKVERDIEKAKKARRRK